MLFTCGREIHPILFSRCALWVTWEHGLELKIVKLGLFETTSPFLRNNRNQNSNQLNAILMVVTP